VNKQREYEAFELRLANKDKDTEIKGLKRKVKRGKLISRGGLGLVVIVLLIVI
jgi:hypothetical protein